MTSVHIATPLSRNKKGQLTRRSDSERPKQNNFQVTALPQHGCMVGLYVGDTLRLNVDGRSCPEAQTNKKELPDTSVPSRRHSC